MNLPIRLGCRKSDLARIQSTIVLEHLRSLGLSCEWSLIESDGDKDSQSALYDIGTPGLFTKQLEQALIAKEIDVAVHSLKDLPTDQPSELEIAAVLKRATAQDVLVCHPAYWSEQEPIPLKPHSIVGTSSLRREAAVSSLRKDLKVVPLRGNVPTRVEKVRSAAPHAAILARAGLDRLKINLDDLKVHPLPVSVFVPAPGQGALAVEVHKDCDRELKEALYQLHDPSTAKTTTVERSILRRLEGGCTLPLGVFCTLSPAPTFRVQAFLGIHGPENSETRHWTGFHHFDISESDEAQAIEKAVSFFKNIQHESS